MFDKFCQQRVRYQTQYSYSFVLFQKVIFIFFVFVVSSESQEERKFSLIIYVISLATVWHFCKQIKLRSEFTETIVIKYKLINKYMKSIKKYLLPIC